MTKDKRDVLLASVVENTDEWQKEVYDVVEKMTKKGKALSKVLSEMTFGKEDKDRLATLLSEISGERVVIEKDEDIEFRALTALVLTKVADHNYETEKVIISLGDGTAIDHTGKVGGFIKPSRKIVRPATEDEIKSITEEQIKGLAKEVNLVFVKSKDSKD